MCDPNLVSVVQICPYSYMVRKEKKEVGMPLPIKTVILLRGEWENIRITCGRHSTDKEVH